MIYMNSFVSLLLRNANLLNRTRNWIHSSFIKSSFFIQTADMSSETESKPEPEMTIDDSKCAGGATSLEEAREKYEFFWKKDSPFSQWHESSFHVDGIEFNCAEQYVMYKKAELFGDKEIAEKVLTKKAPRVQKALGQKIKTFDDEVWKKNCRRIVEEGIEAKFGQNENLKKILFATHPKILVEANPVDKIWGIGCAEDNANAWNERSWQGSNYLGYCLTNVRKTLMEKDDHPKDVSSEAESKPEVTIDRSKCDGGATSLEEARQKYEFFWRKLSPFSQHHEAAFKVDGIEFNCAEQYMMYKKALLFGDEEIAEQVLSTKSPPAQKSLGRKVKNFDDEFWKKNCKRIVEEGNEAKFRQNGRLKKILFATYPKILVEASPVDTVWGIGYAEDNINAWDERSWRGSNYLGYCLTNVRKTLMEEEGLPKDVSSEAESKPEVTVDRSKCDGGATSLEEARQKYEFFWKKLSPFSQHHEAAFKVDDIEFNCAEQYMMYKKALLFGDEEIAEQVLSTKSPQAQKSLGRKVKNFDDEIWKKNCKRIVEEGNVAKFGQNGRLKKILFATYPKILVEASPVDTVWGIGYAEDNINAWDERSWRGSNYLGYCLTNVRKTLMEKEGLLKD